MATLNVAIDDVDMVAKLASQVAPCWPWPEARSEMSDARTAMIRALKAIVVPRLRDLGFTGSFPHFRRCRPTLTELLTFQFDRHGGGFVLELGQCDTDFSVVWPTGERIPPDKITPGHLPHGMRARIPEATGTWDVRLVSLRRCEPPRAI